MAKESQKIESQNDKMSHEIMFCDSYCRCTYFIESNLQHRKVTGYSTDLAHINMVFLPLIFVQYGFSA